MTGSFDKKNHLSRHLGLFSLIAYGINYMIPLAPAIIFGFILKESGGTVALPYLIALVGMIFTALCYCFFIQKAPYAGSVFSYTSYAFNSKFIGGITGWNILLDYILVPAVTAESSAHYIHQVASFISVNTSSILLIIICGSLSLLSIKSIGRFGILFLIASETILIITLFVWGKSVYQGSGTGTLFSIEPFQFSSLKNLLSSTSLALLSFLGFDAISTLSEEAINPRKNIPKAIIICMVIGAVTMFLTGYLGVSVIPNWEQFTTNNDVLSSIVFYINQTTGGHILNQFYIIFFVTSMCVFGIVAITGASRLLYGIAKDGILPQKISSISHLTKTPTTSILVVISLQIMSTILFPVNILAEVVNYGAISAFFLLGIATLKVGLQSKSYLITAIGIISSLINISLIFNMNPITLKIGLIWTILGVIYMIFVIKLRPYHEA